MKVLTVRKKHSASSKNNPVAYFDVTIVLRTESEEEIDWMQSLSEEYHKTYIITDLQAYKKCLIEGNLLKMNECTTMAYISKELPLRKTSRKDTYVFHEYFTDCPSVNALLGELEYIRDGGDLSNSRSTQYCHITSILKALDNFWD